jgi:hypothetical protein
MGFSSLGPTELTIGFCNVLTAPSEAIIPTDWAASNQTDFSSSCPEELKALKTMIPRTNFQISRGF